MKMCDKLTCKKTLTYYNDVLFIKNNSYKILYHDDQKISVDCGKKMGYNVGSVDFKLYTPNSDHYKFEEYFYLPQEIRKLKIQKLNESVQ